MRYFLIFSFLLLSSFASATIYRAGTISNGTNVYGNDEMQVVDAYCVKFATVIGRDCVTSEDAKNGKPSYKEKNSSGNWLSWKNTIVLSSNDYDEYFDSFTAQCTSMGFDEEACVNQAATNAGGATENDIVCLSSGTCYEYLPDNYIFVNFNSDGSCSDGVTCSITDNTGGGSGGGGSGGGSGGGGSGGGSGGDGTGAALGGLEGFGLGDGTQTVSDDFARNEGGFCSDGLPSNLFGYLNCDRPKYKTCNNQYILEDDVCPVADPFLQPDAPTPNEDLELAILESSIYVADRAEFNSLGIMQTIQESANYVAESNRQALNIVDKNNSVDTNRIVDAINELGNTECEEGEDCEDDIPASVYSIGSEDSLATTGNGFLSDLLNVPLVSAIGNLPNMIDTSNSACPEININLVETLGVEVSTTVHCDIANTVFPIFSYVMIAVYSILGFRIVASA